MSFSASDPSVGVAGVNVVADAPVGGGPLGGGPAVSAPVVGSVGVGGVLAFTGSGPGTLPLAILGAVSVIGGLFAAAAGKKRRKKVADAPENGLTDLSLLADTATAPTAAPAISWRLADAA